MTHSYPRSIADLAMQQVGSGTVYLAKPTDALHSPCSDA